MIELLKKLLLNWDVYNITTSRREFWLTQLSILKFMFIWVLFCYPLAILFQPGDAFFGFVLLLPSMVFALPNIAMMCRRLNDTGYSRWLMVIMVVPFANIFIYVVMALPEGHYKTNFQKPGMHEDSK